MDERRQQTIEKRRRNKALLWRFLKGSKALYAVSILSAGITALADMAEPQVIRMAVDNALGGKEAHYMKPVMTVVNALGGFSYLGSHIWIMALAVLAIASVRVFSQYTFRVSNTKASETLVKTMRDQLFSHIERLPFSWHMKNHTGDIIQRCTSDVDTLRNFVSEQLTNVFRIVLLVILSLSFMLSMNRKLTLISFLPLPVIVLYSLIFYRKVSEGFLQCDENEGKLSDMVQENLTGVRVVRAFAAERRERERFEAQNEYYTGLWVKLGKVLSLYWSSQDILSGVQMLLVVVFGASFCISGEMTSGEYIAFLAYNTMLIWPVRMLGRMLTEMSKAGVSIGRIEEIMSAEEEKDLPDASEPPLDRDICFEHVSYAYENGPEILHDISFTMKAGSTLGIIAGTGMGKSTLMLLLDKMINLPEGHGRITIGGVDIRRIKTAWLRKNIGFVMQEPFLFSRTIAENIAIAAPSVEPEDVRAASRAACLDETVTSFTKGYDTFVGERGVTLSGGQKQRAAIARTLISPAPIMIFDDSLSAVDTETDARIRAELEARFGTASIILISHRITTLSKADRILVLDSGRISQEGTHEELIRQEGVYREIYEIQSGIREEAI
ncbi:MAG: ABC transporter ATP-binding protein [Oscillospiraceae bacterium]|nr:ABC transporter ATP-binding protein [Oscillospiraceae bacterium]